MPAWLPSAAVAAPVLVALHACTGAPQRSTPRYAVVADDGDLEEAAERTRGGACDLAEDIAGQVLSAPDPEACGPFPCSHGGCFVQRCRATQDCAGIGLCSAGFCLAARPHGERECGPLRDPSAATRSDYADRAGCRCTPDGARGRDPRACGSLPCSPEGCYVQRCDRDADCEHGLCSANASSPHGYCVTDDPR